MSSRNSQGADSWEKIKNTVLGEKYELSLVFVGNKESQRLNRIYRGIDSPTNILSFPLSKTSGEIFINKTLAWKEMAKFSMDFDTFIKYLFIHGLLHLKGMSHGATMEKREREILKKFQFKNNGENDISRNRRRNTRNKSRDRRRSPRERQARS